MVPGPCHEDRSMRLPHGWEVREVAVLYKGSFSVPISPFRSEPMASIYQISHDIHDIRIIRTFTTDSGLRPAKVDVNTALLLAQRHHVAERFAELTLAAHFEQLEDPNDTKALASRLEARHRGSFAVIVVTKDLLIFEER